MFWRHLHQFSATVSWLSENFCRLARKWGKPSTSLQFAVCLPLHCGRHINSGWQIKHGHDHWQYHCICRLVYGLHYCLRLPEHRTRAYTQKKKKKAGNKYSGTQAHTNTNGHIYIKKGGKWRRNFYRRRFSRHLCLPFQRFPGQEGIVFEPNLLASWR